MTPSERRFAPTTVRQPETVCDMDSNTRPIASESAIDGFAIASQFASCPALRTASAGESANRLLYIHFA
jgi:hypothetical protein